MFPVAGQPVWLVAVASSTTSREASEQFRGFLFFFADRVDAGRLKPVLMPEA